MKNEFIRTSQLLTAANLTAASALAPTLSFIKKKRFRLKYINGLGLTDGADRCVDEVIHSIVL